MAVSIDGVLVDIPKAERGFQRYSSEIRSNMQSSHRLGWKQKQAIGEAYWTHPYCPGVCFPTKAAAYRAALQTISRSGVNA